MSKDQAAAAAATPRRSRSRGRRLLRGSLVALLLCALSAFSALAWLLGTQSGLDAALVLLQRGVGPALELEGGRGKLLGMLEFDRLRYRDDELHLEARGLRLEWEPRALLQRRLHLSLLQLGEIDFAQRAADPAAATAGPSAAPESLQLPLALDIDRIELKRFALHAWPRAADAPAVEESFWLATLRAAVHSTGRTHQLQVHEAQFAQGEFAFEAGVDGHSPFALSATGKAQLQLDDLAIELRIGARENLLTPELLLELALAEVAITAQLQAAPFAPLPLQQLKLTTSEFNPAALHEDLPQGRLRVDAELQARGDRAVGGPVRVVNRQPASLDDAGLPLRSVVAELEVELGNTAVAINDLVIKLLGGGEVRGGLNWRPTEATGEGTGAAANNALGELQAKLELAAIDMHALDRRLPAQRLSGVLSARADEQLQEANARLRLGAARLRAQARLAMAEDAAAATAHASATAGAYRRFALSAALREVEPRALLAEAPAARLNVDLEASGELDAEGLPALVDASFAIVDSTFEGYPLSGEGRLQLVGELLPQVAVVLDLAGNRLQADGAWGKADDRLVLELDAGALARLGEEFDGRLVASAELGGTLQLPQARMELVAEALRLPGGVRVQGLSGAARLDAGLEGPFQLSLEATGVGEGAARSAVAAPPDWVESLHLVAAGTRARHEIELELGTAALGQAQDRLQLALQGGVTEEPGAGMGWQGELRTLATNGQLAMRLLAPAALEASAQHLRLGTAELGLEEGGLLLLEETAWTPQLSTARGRLSGFSLGWLGDRLAAYQGDDPLVFGGNWSLQAGTELNGELQLFRERGVIELAGELPLRLELETLEAALLAQGHHLRLDARVAGPELGTMQLTVATAAERDVADGWSLPGSSPLAGRLRFDMPDLSWLDRLLADQGVQIGGSLDADVSLSGTLQAPRFQGRSNGHRLALNMVDEGLALEGGELRLSFNEQQLRLEGLDFVASNRVQPRDNRLPVKPLTATPGTLHVSGEVELDRGVGAFRLEADRLPLLQRRDRWLILSGKGNARSGPDALQIKADFGVDAAYIEFAETLPPSLSDDVVLVSDEESASADFALSAEIGVVLGDAVYLSAMGLDTRLAGQLQLQLAPGAPLAAVGTVRTVDGRYQGYGQSLVIDRGVVNFQGPLDAPGLNIVALRKGLAVEAGIAVTGSAKRPQVKLVSEPNVPDPDKLSWIVLGRAPDTGSGADLGLLLPAAQALLGGPGGGMTEELSRSLGFDSFSIGQGELNSTSRVASSRVLGSGSTVAADSSVSSQVLSVGKRLGPDLFLSFEQSLGGAETLAKLSYQLSRRLSAVLRGGSDNSLDLYYGIHFR